MPHQELYIEGVRVPGVTDIIATMDKPWLRPWYAKEELKRCVADLAAYQAGCPIEDRDKELRKILACWRKRIKEKSYAAENIGGAARYIGTKFHEYVDLLTSNKAFDEVVVNAGDQLTQMLRNWYDWYVQYGFITDEREQHVVSKKWFYQGTFDAVGRSIGGHGLIVADWKTSSKMDDEYGMQLAAYAYAYGEQKGWTEQETWQRIQTGLAVRVDKKAENGWNVDVKEFRELPYYFRVFTSLREPHDFMRKTGIWEENLE